MSKKTLFFLVLMCLIGAVFRFYNLSWGSPYFFHPDERNIASAIAQLSFPSQLNPNFFAYGSLPIYSAYSLGILINIFLFFVHPTNIFAVSFEQALLLGRFLSAFLSLGLIPLLFIIGKKLKDTNTGLLAAFFATTSIGLMQYAHFSTFEIWLTFFSTLLFYFCLLFLQKNTKKITVGIGLVFGILMSIKISSIVLLFPILLMFLFSKSVKKILFSLSLFLLCSLSVFSISNPFVLLSPSEFLSSMQYESSVALHTLPVFYTQGFTATIPLLYQLLYVFPFILNPFLLLLCIPACIFFIYKTIQKKSLPFGLLILFLLTLFLSQGFLFAKWTRYMIPTLPFIYLILAIVLIRLKKTIILSSSIVMCSFYAIVFVGVVYYQKDTRIAAMEWATRNIPPQAAILSEVYDLGIVPFNQQFTAITLFNFYDLDSEVDQHVALKNHVKKARYIILPSQRILKTRTNNPKEFPKGFSFYQSLLLEDGYTKIYQTPCNTFCKIIYMGDPVFSVEETTNVFDRPTVYIFQKK